MAAAVARVGGRDGSEHQKNFANARRGLPPLGARRPSTKIPAPLVSSPSRTSDLWRLRADLYHLRHCVVLHVRCWCGQYCIDCRHCALLWAAPMFTTWVRSGLVTVQIILHPTEQVSSRLAISCWQCIDKLLVAQQPHVQPCIRQNAAGGCRTAASMWHQYWLPDTALPLNSHQSSLVKQSPRLSDPGSSQACMCQGQQAAAVQGWLVSSGCLT
jgi:hypothetical protein